MRNGTNLGNWLKGLSMLLVFSGAMVFLVRAGDGWAITAKSMIVLMGAWLGWHGATKIIAALHAEVHRCYLCLQEASRYCDFQMHDDSDCGRWACGLHIHVNSDGKRDYCSEHWDKSGGI